MNFNKLLFINIVFLFCSSLCFAQDIYISQTSQGSDTGVDCSNSHSVLWFNTEGNWGDGAGKIAPGDTAHLCGTITTALTFQASGANGNSITILFESGAKMSTTSWGAEGAINSNGKNYLSVDGGNNGLIENTGNGTALEIQQHSTGVTLTSCEYCEIKNLTVSNLYVRTPYSSDSNNYGSGLVFAGSSSHSSIHDNSVNNANTGVVWSLAGGTTTEDIDIYYNNVTECSNGITVGSGGTGAVADNVNIYGNTIYGNEIWGGSWTPPPGDGHHHSDGIQCWANHTASSITNLSIYNNSIGPDLGIYTTGWIFTEGYISGQKIYNNLLTAESPSSPTNGFIFVKGPGGDNSKIMNNTIVSYGAGTGIALGSDADNADIRNNTVSDCNTGIYVDDTSSIFTSDYNSFYSLGSNQMRYPPGFYQFSNWQSTLNFDQHSTTRDPLLDYLYIPIFNADSKSPAIDAGTDLSTFFTMDKRGIIRSGRGITWDIGAYETGKLWPPSSFKRIP